MGYQPDVTVLLARASGGDPAAQNVLAPLVYAELKGRAEALMRGERNAQSIQATVLVNDAYMRLLGGAEVDFASRTHFFAIASNVMRRVLVEHARARNRQKRGGGVEKVEFDEARMLSIDSDDDVLALEDALTRLAAVDARQADIVTMRFFGGMSMAEVADSLGISKRSCEREWSMIKAWLRRELAP